ncbi:MAG: amidohydrolase [Bacteroidales bacterium]|nr:amidohydrolase [Bacteroidales bacterium]
MKEQLKVCLVQADLVWENIEANLHLMEGMLETLEKDTGLVVFPETFSTGFTMRSVQLAEGEDGKAVRWLLRMAREKQCHMSGSLIFREKDGRIYNRLLWVSPDGIQGFYDKRHLFRPGGEKENFSRGEERKIFRLGAFRILPQICYDLRFPVFSRNRGDYDVMLYVANWPATRHPVWETLCRARAMENQSYLLGVNRVGTDGTGIPSLGGSCSINPMGGEMLRMNAASGLGYSELNLEKLRNFRKKFPAWKDADHFEPGWKQ